MTKYKNVERDVYFIVERLRKMDPRYSVKYDEEKKIFFLFDNNSCSLSLGKTLDKKSIDTVFFSHIRNKYALLDGMDKNNEKMEREQNEYISRKTKQELKDYIEYADRKGGDIDFSRANTTFWL